jgi:hypothetical protein
VTSGQLTVPFIIFGQAIDMPQHFTASPLMIYIKIGS